MRKWMSRSVRWSCAIWQQVMKPFSITIRRLALAWNPQGDQLAFVAPPDSAETGSFGPLHLIDATTGAERVLVEDFVLAFFWSPDGRQIAYLTLRPEFQGE